MIFSLMSADSSWPRFHFLGDCAHGLDDLNPAAVAQRHHERQAVVFGKRRDGFAQMFLHIFRQAINLADDFEAHIVFVQILAFRF